ncbi:MAG: 2Fe-2S iron-sulfur cluster binding domain-containing protein [bacterium]|nr:2Fe-2S iron-sulfur cluster binding domain-containing protein [bacterium]
MGGTNPYNQEVEVEPPTKKYSITFLPMNETIEVDPTALPYSREGLSGSILDIACGHEIDIEHACGGVCACSTCHIIVREGFDSIPSATEDEEDMLDTAPGLEMTSRLSCQAVPDGSVDLIVEIPDWNRNHAKESH